MHYVSAILIIMTSLRRMVGFRKRLQRPAQVALTVLSLPWEGSDLGLSLRRIMAGDGALASCASIASIDLSHTRGAPPSNARENEDVWDTSAWQHR